MGLIKQYDKSLKQDKAFRKWDKMGRRETNMIGYIVMGIGTVLAAAGLIIAIITAATAPSAKRKIEKRMKEKY